MALIEDLARHAPADVREAEHLKYILAFVAAHPDPFDRRIAEGHLTGSALILSHAGDQVLLLHHLKLDRWLQPGGHADPGESTGEAVALREAAEETGLSRLALHPTAPRPLDVDVHAIPARGTEAAHQHLDLRYLVMAPTGSLEAARLKPDESRALRWFDWSELPALGLDAGLQRALRKARAILGNVS